MNSRFLSRVVLVLNTVRYLKLKQVFYRVYYKLRSNTKIKLEHRLVSHSDWIFTKLNHIGFSNVGETSACFLGLCKDITKSDCWNDSSVEKLWLYNLHYYDFLNSQTYSGTEDSQLKLVIRWIDENPPLLGNGWEPYPISIRLVNWIKWYKRVGVVNSAIIYSIDLQAQALFKQLEYHILGNHLFANAKALIFAGCFLKGGDADHYLRTGLKILDTEIPEQFLDDGGHFERSPMYHCTLLWDLLDLINLATITSRPEFDAAIIQWRRVAEKALHWLAVMQHPDGEVSFFNDSTFGIAATPAQLFDYAVDLKLAVGTYPLSELVTLPASGYSRVSMPEHMLLFDHAAIGPDYLPGHAHADTLSIEWSVGLERVLVNSGTSLYGISQERIRQRQTAAHNTVEVDNLDSSEVWGGFRVARRAYTKLLNATTENGSVLLLASHDGYTRLKGNVVHLRKVEANKKSLIITDKLEGKFGKATAHWHLHPDVKVQQLSSFELMLTLCSGKLVSIKCDVPVQVLPSTWHPGFGEAINSHKIIANFSSDKMNITFFIV